PAEVGHDDRLVMTLQLFPGQDPSELDLSSLRLAFNGAEPIDARMLQRFEERFAAAKYRPEAMFPVYGLAEATLAVSFPPCDAAPTIQWFDGRRLANEGIAEPVAPDNPSASPVVGVGHPVPEVEVRIASRKTAPQSDDQLPSGHVGRVEIRGPSVTIGYLSDPEATAASMRDGWFDTGDLGFFHDGELFITGREKEMIIVRGENFYPQDVEALAKGVEGVYRGRAVAFAATNPERIVVVAETILEDIEPHRALARAIAQTIARGLGLAQVEVHVVKKGEMKRTTSGKWQRIRMRTMVEQEAFSGILASHSPVSAGASTP
ncbi:MAG: AMP-binding protein, partial [Myxococcota bacterium]